MTELIHLNIIELGEMQQTVRSIRRVMGLKAKTKLCSLPEILFDYFDHAVEGENSVGT
jgi:hypothetical protein